MASRNRTHDFKKLKESYNNDFSSDTKYLLDNKNYSDFNNINNINNTNNTNNINNTNNNIFDFDNQIKITKIKIEKQIEELIKLQNKRLMVNFTTDDDAMELKIENFVKEITNNIKIIQNNIVKASKIKNIDNVFKKNFIDAQSLSLQELITKLRKCQKTYLEKIDKQKKINSDKLFWNKNIENDNTSQLENNNTYKKNNLTDSQLLVQDQILNNSINEYETIIEERDKEINQICKSIQELSEMFNEVNMLVHKQGSMLDRIDYNMECAVENVKSGNKQLVKADDYQKSASSTSRGVILGLVGMIGLMSGIFAIKKTRGF